MQKSAELQNRIKLQAFEKRLRAHAGKSTSVLASKTTTQHKTNKQFRQVANLSRKRRPHFAGKNLGPGSGHLHHKYAVHSNFQSVMVFSRYHCLALAAGCIESKHGTQTRNVFPCSSPGTFTFSKINQLQQDTLLCTVGFYWALTRKGQTNFSQRRSVCSSQVCLHWPFLTGSVTNVALRCCHQFVLGKYRYYETRIGAGFIPVFPTEERD